MAAIFRERIAQKQKTIFKGDPVAVDTKLMLDLAIKKDPLSISIFREAGEAIGYVLSGIFNLLGIEAAVIGGGGAGAFEFM